MSDLSAHTNAHDALPAHIRDRADPAITVILAA
jgi:hypothetical protein